MATTEITKNEADRLRVEGESLGGYGWVYDRWHSAWIAGHTFERPDGSRFTIERRSPTGEHHDCKIYLIDDLWEPEP